MICKEQERCSYPIFISLRLKNCTNPNEVKILRRYGESEIKKIKTPIYVKHIDVKRKYLGIAGIIHERNYQIERTAYIENPELYNFKDKVYQQRNFPSSLRHFIFEKDNYACQICLKHKKQLLKEKKHLEVDHILAWQDGGKTTYSNGQTICSDCNKGKHHAKKHLQAVA